MERPASYTAAVAEAAEAATGSQAPLRLPTLRRATGHQVARTPVTLELNADLVPLIRRLAEALHVSPASVVDLLAYEGLRRYLAGHVDVDEHLRSSRSPAYWYVIDIDFEPLRQALATALDAEREVSP